jgi:hypothetical protein
MTEFSRNTVELFKAFEQLEKTEPGFQLHPAFLRVKGLTLAMARASMPPQEQRSSSRSGTTGSGNCLAGAKSRSRRGAALPGSPHRSA